MALIGDMGAKTARSIAVIVAAIAVALFLLWTDQGAMVLAAVRCSPTWLTADRAAYQACFDFEREQTIENRAKRHTRFDE